MELTTDRGEVFTTYLVGESHQDKGILIIHDGWGVLSYNHEWADRFAQAGYQAMVIDLFDGQHPSEHRDVSIIAHNLDQSVVNQKLQLALSYLKDHVKQVAVLGWSFGGVQAQQAAFNYPELVDALVLYYCRILINKQKAQQINCPVLTFFAENERTWPDKQADLEQVMYEADKTLTCYSYEADTGFVNPDSDYYDDQASDSAWQHTLQFLAESLH